MKHVWGPSLVGHGVQQCVNCYMTFLEAQVLGDDCLNGSTYVPVSCDHVSKAEYDRLLERYKYLCDMAYLDDMYDHGSTRSSWDWVVRLETGKSKGLCPPDDTPSFEETLDAAIAKTKTP